ncbi:hypothetical protein KY382_12060, partial [Pseudomonas monteilii]|nr:hypothetical protein [Pseudomonas monteilii]
KQLNTWVSFQSAEQPLLGQFSVSGNIPSASGAGFDLYDNHSKTRLILNFPTRAEADYECDRRNNQCGASGSTFIEGDSRYIGRELRSEGAGSRYVGYG